MADRVVVMYAGKVMERGGVHDVFETPAHPYTQALLRCLPGRGERRETIGGEFPNPIAPPTGCRFHPRCPHAVEDCTGGEQPPLEPANDNETHLAACVFYDENHDTAVVQEDAVDRAPQATGQSKQQTDGGHATGRGQ